jgi:transcriptional regulator with XRE-family HTH domain
MNQSFGARLRAQRELQQVSLSAISAKLKIKLSLLEQLENDRVTHWPKGIFGRAFLRDYARSIGMDPEPLVREFLTLHPDTSVDPFTRETDAAVPAAPAFRRHIEPEVMLEIVPEVTPPVSQPAPLAAATEPIGDRRRGLDRRALNLAAAADLCSKLARALDASEVTALLADAARLLDAVGVVVWQWDADIRALRAAVAHGYSDAMLARLPAVRGDESNAIAAAFRSGEACLVCSGDGTTGAVVIPSLGPGGCVGVLALEVRCGGEQSESVRAFATILAAQLGTLLPSPS